MINHPVTYHRDFRNDFPPQTERPDEQLIRKCQKVAVATLPLLSLHRSLRAPISFGMSGVRSITHISQMTEHLQAGRINAGLYHFLHASLATSAVGFFFFNPTLSFLSSSVSDFIINSRSFIEQAYDGKIKEALEALAYTSMDLLFLASICYGAIEITVACMIMQVLLDLHNSAENFKQGDYLGGMCQTLLAVAHMHQAVPQLKVLQWKQTHNPVLTAELKQTKDGFVYLDIPDEYVKTLFPLCDDPKAVLPPYFGKGMAGAHVSVISADEMKASSGITIDDIGKKFSFRIVNADSVKPDGWKGVDKVHFLTLACPEIEAMRTRHGFSPKMGNHDYHITFGIQRTEQLSLSKYGTGLLPA